MATARRSILVLALILVLLFAMCFLVVSCGARDDQTSRSAAEIASAIAAGQELGGANALRAEDDDFAPYVSVNYRIDATQLADGAIYYAGGTSAAEIAILVFKDGADIAACEEALRTYIDNRTVTFYGYAPAEALLLEQAVVAANGNYVALLICDSPNSAEQAFFGVFGELAESSAGAGAAGGAANITRRAATIIPNEYDAAAVLRAFQTGDSSALSQKNKSILGQAARVIDELITASMTDYEKELIIHDWILDWAEYDVGSMDQSPDARPHPDNDNPYGLLVGRRAICSGYSSTFQLFMDMLGIECLTVSGTTYDGAAEHAWNQVKLGGEWYCVDVTWNDPVGAGFIDEWTHHQYFNVTSRYMFNSGHVWDRNAVPEATATDYSWLQVAA